MLLASLGSVSRAMVGMAAGATHAALTQHFAAAGSNPADISAKAESRERATSIIGSLLGMAFTHKLAGEARGRRKCGMGPADVMGAGGEAGMFENITACSHCVAVVMML
jgi:hypothetical protein